MELSQNHFKTTCPWVSGDPGLSHFVKGAGGGGGESRVTLGNTARCGHGTLNDRRWAVQLDLPSALRSPAAFLHIVSFSLSGPHPPGRPAHQTLTCLSQTALQLLLAARLRPGKPLSNSPARLRLGPCPG